LYYFRDQQGLEVDFLVPRSGAGVWLIEARAGKTVYPAMAASLLALRRALGKKSNRLIVVHRNSRSSISTSAVAGGVEALDLEDSPGSFRMSEGRLRVTTVAAANPD
jgi:uncharacterized protein